MRRRPDRPQVLELGHLSLSVSHLAARERNYVRCSALCVRAMSVSC